MRSCDFYQNVPPDLSVCGFVLASCLSVRALQEMLTHSEQSTAEVKFIHALFKMNSLDLQTSFKTKKSKYGKNNFQALFRNHNWKKGEKSCAVFQKIHASCGIPSSAGDSTGSGRILKTVSFLLSLKNTGTMLWCVALHCLHGKPQITLLFCWGEKCVTNCYFFIYSNKVLDIDLFYTFKSFSLFG